MEEPCHSAPDFDRRNKRTPRIKLTPLVVEALSAGVRYKKRVYGSSFICKLRSEIDLGSEDISEYLLFLEECDSSE